MAQIFQHWLGGRKVLQCKKHSTRTTCISVVRIEVCIVKFPEFLPKFECPKVFCPSVYVFYLTSVAASIIAQRT